ncbi:hypothetical protein N0V93_004117 [Gnomoniopsis smithogilvyi]|uniref:Carrier domain-containing protein n=1 Tax=Gnomoniopsis smithogilvyi TaxID=1191159 RepID=A0A9W8Z1R8_9PEZI|nr:hypothetical protein N0V93_004117 [Gnomoniopsis smithogilvyi]
MEQHIVSKNAEVASAVVVGTRRFQPALLIEPVALRSGESLNTVEEAQMIERLWPSVQEANRKAPAYARVEKAFMLILPGPVIRAGKGTIQRAASIEKYASSIDALYKNADVTEGIHDESLFGVSATVNNLTNVNGIERFVRECVDNVTGWVGATTSKPRLDEKNRSGTFFDRGMDSLMALQLLRALRRGLNRPDLGLSTIYSNPTLSQLAKAVSLQSYSSDDDVSLMESLLRTYNGLIRQIPKPASEQPAEHLMHDGPTTAILTGSTGTIGTFLLYALLNRSSIKHVICLNRSEDGGRAAQKARFAAAGLEVDELGGRRVTYLHADLSQPLLGLDKARYLELCKAGLIIHNAWPVNFNLRLGAFEPQLAGLVNLFRLAADTTLDRPSRLVFVSSVGAVGGLAVEGKLISETVFTSLDTPSSNGYARSKFLSEILCKSAAKYLGIYATIARVGQVAGAVRHSGGEWNRTEWLPSLVIGSRDLGTGCLPDNIGPLFANIDWIPVDILADVLADIATVASIPKLDEATSPEHDGTLEVLNVRNPCTTTWKSLLPTIIDVFKTRLQPGESPIIVTPSAWLERLSVVEHEAADNRATSPNRALKLFEFYRDSLWGTMNKTTKPMDIGNTLERSTALRETQAVNSEWMRKWVEEWMAVDDFERSNGADIQNVGDSQPDETFCA